MERKEGVNLERKWAGDRHVGGHWLSSDMSALRAHKAKQVAFANVVHQLSGDEDSLVSGGHLRFGVRSTNQQVTGLWASNLHTLKKP